jgi:triacylglycerol esterase/lipase EstA (alpha/beta hydrolase family)
MWTAVTLAVAYLALFGMYGAWAAARVAEGSPAWPFLLGLPFVWVAIPTFVTATSFFVAWRFGAPRPSGHRLPRRLDAGPMAWREFATVVANTPRMIAYRALMPDPAPAPAARPILLLHGVLCNAGVWHPFRRHLDREGIGPVYALSYGPPLDSIDDFAEQLAAKIERVRHETGADKVVLVGHSMGGLVARAYLQRYGGANVTRLITVGTPHEGSVHARLFPGTSLSQLRPGNAWLAGLGPPARDTPPIVSLWSWHDSMVSPQTSSRIGFGENVELTGVAHNALLTDPVVHRRLTAQIRRGLEGAP